MSYKTANINAELHKEFKIFCSEKGVKMVDELEKIIKQHCGAICTSEDCKIFEYEVLGGYCIFTHSGAENIEKALEVYSKSEEEYPFCDIVVKALKKQISSKIIPWDGHSNSGVCPNCNENISKYDYCPLCGQKLDWSYE